MPQLDVSFMTMDPMLADSFEVTRRLNVMGNDGRVTAVPDTQYSDLRGVVTQQDPADLIRTEDGQTIPRRIFIASTFQFLAAAPGQQPDEITWDENVYTVSEVFPYSRFGVGTYECIAEVRKMIPEAQ